MLKGERLYGRGGADDGYAAFASLTAIEALQRQKIPHARCVVLIEACEESGSFDLPFYVDHLADRIGTPSLVVCLDSGCGNYEQLWGTTSLRGIVTGDLTVEVLKEGVHSGDASGLVPSSFRILRQLLTRLEDPATGEILPKDYHVEIPQQRLDQVKVMAGVLGDEIHSKYPWAEGVQPVSTDPIELVLNRTWRPALSVTGVAGMPALEDAGNVLQAQDLGQALVAHPAHHGRRLRREALGQEIFEADPPYGARVTFTSPSNPAAGWNAPEMAPWLIEAVDAAPRRLSSRNPRPTWARAARSPSWACWARSSPRPSS